MRRFLEILLYPLAWLVWFPLVALWDVDLGEEDEE